MSIYDNSEVDAAIARVQAALATSDLRNVNTKLAKLNKSRSDYKSRSNQAKAFKPNGVTMPTMASPRATERVDRLSKSSPRAMERVDKLAKSSPRVTERNKTKTTVKKKDTSFKKAGILPALTSPEAKNFWNTFNKKGLLPALRNK
jgi:hypothetical protein